MTSKVNVNVCLTDENRLEQALNYLGFDDFEMLRKLRITGKFADNDFRFSLEKLVETLQELENNVIFNRHLSI